MYEECDLGQFDWRSLQIDLGRYSRVNIVLFVDEHYSLFIIHYSLFIIHSPYIFPFLTSHHFMHFSYTIEYVGDTVDEEDNIK